MADATDRHLVTDLVGAAAFPSPNGMTESRRGGVWQRRVWLWLCKPHLRDAHKQKFKQINEQQMGDQHAAEACQTMWEPIVFFSS